MSLAFSACSAAAAAACGWPASAAIERLGTTSEAAGSLTADAEGPHPRQRRAPRPWLLAVLLAASAWIITVRLHPALVAVAACWLTACGVPLTAIDVRTRRLPDTLTAACLAGVVGFLALAAVGTANWLDVARAGAGGLAVGAFFALLALTRPGSAGLGDAKLGLSTGALAGWFGWGVVVGSMVAAFVLAAALGCWLLATGRATLRGTNLPFGPSLLGGCLAVTLLARVGHGQDPSWATFWL